MFNFFKRKNKIGSNPSPTDDKPLFPTRGQRATTGVIDDACNMDKNEMNEVLDNYNKDNKLPKPIRPIPMPECKLAKEDKIEELYNWLKGERYGYFLEDHKTWINYGELNDKFPYDEAEKKWELSRNRMIEKTLRKMEELNLINKESEEK